MRAHVQPPRGVHVVGADILKPAWNLDPGMGMQDVEPAEAVMGIVDRPFQRGVPLADVPARGVVAAVTVPDGMSVTSGAPQRRRR